MQVLTGHSYIASLQLSLQKGNVANDLAIEKAFVDHVNP